MGGGSVSGSGLPISSVTAYAGNTVPEDWLECDGRPLNKTDYAELFAEIGTTYGGSGSNFNLPNLNDKFVIGGTVPGTNKGIAEIILETANLPTHNHTFTGGAVNSASTTPGATGSTTPGATGSTTPGASGSAGAHEHTINNFDGARLGIVGIAATPGTHSFTLTGVGQSYWHKAGSAGAHTHTSAAHTHTSAAHTHPSTAHQHSITAVGTIGNTGSGTAFSNIPPSVTMKYIIKVK